MTNTAKPPGPSMRKRVLLTLFLVLPFLILAGLMYAIGLQFDKQGASLGEKPAQSASE